MIVTEVSRKPIATWSDRADPAVPGGASSDTADENCAESATTVIPHTSATAKTIGAGEPNSRPGDERAGPRHGHRRDGHRRPADRSAKAPASSRCHPRPRRGRPPGSPARRRRRPRRRTRPAGTAGSTSTSRTAPTCGRGSRCWRGGPPVRGSRQRDRWREARRGTSNGPVRRQPDQHRPAEGGHAGRETVGRQSRPAYTPTARNRYGSAEPRVSAPMTSPDGQAAVAPEPARDQLDPDRIDRGDGEAGQEAERQRGDRFVARARSRGWRPPRRRTRSRTAAGRAGHRRAPTAARPSAPTAKPTWTATVSSGRSRPGRPLLASSGATAAAANRGPTRGPSRRAGSSSCGQRAAGRSSRARLTSGRSGRCV